MFKILSVEMLNFFSYEFCQHDLQEGSAFLSGRNGSGKSTVYEAIYYALYGSTVRSAKNITKYGATDHAVAVTGIKGKSEFTVIRTSKTASLHVDGEELTIGKIGSKVADNAVIEEYIGIPAKHFVSITLFGHNSFRFTRAKDSDRRAIVLSMLDVELLDECYATAYQLAADLTKQISVIQGKIDVLNSGEAKYTESQINTVKKKYAEVEKAEKSVSDSIEKVRSGIRKVLIENGMEDMYNYSNGEIVLEGKLSTLQKNMSSLKADMDSIVNAICPTCGQKMPKALIADKVSDLSKKLDATKKDIDAVKKKLSVLKGKVSTMSDTLSDLEEKMSDIRSKSREYATFLKVVKKLDSKSEKQEKALREQLAKASELLHINSFSLGAFGKYGAVSLMADSVLNQLNDVCADLSERLTGGSLNVTFSPVKENKNGSTQERITMEVFNYDLATAYENLSNGERQKVDLLCMFAWCEMFASLYNNGVNIKFFDEVFEGLDEESSTLLYDYINMSRDKECVYIMSHSPHTVQNTDYSYTVRRDKKGNSFIEER